MGKFAELLRTNQVLGIKEAKRYVGSGTFVAHVLECDFGLSTRGTHRLCWKWKVADGMLSGAEFNTYLPAMLNEPWVNNTIQEWVNYCDAATDTAIMVYDCNPDNDEMQDLLEVMGNLVTVVNGAASKGKLKFIINRKEKVKLAANGHPQFSTNIVEQILD
jgi:hypothetical protein